MNFAQVLKGLEAKEGDVLFDGAGFHWKKVRNGIQALRDCAIYIPDSALVHIPAPAGLGKVVKRKIKKSMWAWRVSIGEVFKDYITTERIDEKSFLYLVKEENPVENVQFWKLQGTEVEVEVEDYVHS